MSEAHHTSASRNRLPLRAPGSRLHCGLPTGALAKMASMTAAPMTGNDPSTTGRFNVNHTLAPIADSRMKPTIARRAPSTRTPGLASFWIGWWACCCLAANTPKMHSATAPPT